MVEKELLLEHKNRRAINCPSISHTLPKPSTHPIYASKEGTLADILYKSCFIHWCLETNQPGRVFRSPLDPKYFFMLFNCFSALSENPIFRINIDSSWPLLISPLSLIGLSRFVSVRIKLNDRLPSQKLSLSEEKKKNTLTRLLVSLP